MFRQCIKIWTPKLTQCIKIGDACIKIGDACIKIGDACIEIGSRLNVLRYGADSVH